MKRKVTRQARNEKNEHWQEAPDNEEKEKEREKKKTGECIPDTPDSGWDAEATIGAAETAPDEQD